MFCQIKFLNIFLYNQFPWQAFPWEHDAKLANLFLEYQVVSSPAAAPANTKKKVKPGFQEIVFLFTSSKIKQFHKSFIPCLWVFVGISHQDRAPLINQNDQRQFELVEVKPRDFGDLPLGQSRVRKTEKKACFSVLVYCSLAEDSYISKGDFTMWFCGRSRLKRISRN